jgi:hypothetical protein
LAPYLVRMGCFSLCQKWTRPEWYCWRLVILFGRRVLGCLSNPGFLHDWIEKLSCLKEKIGHQKGLSWYFPGNKFALCIIALFILEGNRRNEITP